MNNDQCDQLIQLIRDRKAQLTKFGEILRNNKFFEDSVSISNNVDQLVQRSQIDASLFIKRILLFGMVLNQTLEIRNSLEKLTTLLELCRQFRDYVPIKLPPKDQNKFIIQTSIPETKIKLINEFHIMYNQIDFPLNLSFKAVTTRFIQILDLVYNAFAGTEQYYIFDSIFIGKESQEIIRKCDGILQLHIISQIQIYLQQICSLQFEDEISYLLKLDGISCQLDNEI